MICSPRYLIFMNFYLVLGLHICIQPSGAGKTFIMVDGFTEYISGVAKEYCKENDFEFIDVVSPYLCNALKNQDGKIVPQQYRAPLPTKEIEWFNDRIDDTYDPLETCCLSESDAGVPIAERIQTALNLPHRCHNIQSIQNKYEMNKLAMERGISTVKQCQVCSYEEAEDFLLNNLWKDNDDDTSSNTATMAKSASTGRACIIKPCRGVASDGVYLCHSLQEVKDSCNALLGQPAYGGGINTAIVIQEYADGQEYAIDTVSMNGEIKVVAFWKYAKLSMNSAPFVYQCSELIPVSSMEEQAVCEYAIQALTALEMSWGPTHTEVKYTSRGGGPKLIEINPRWHGQDFVEIGRQCLGYDAVTVTMDAYYQPEKFHDIPRLPTKLLAAGRIIHLISQEEGEITKINHVDKIQALSSFQELYLKSQGDYLNKTIDIRTDSGYVVLIHPKEEMVFKDYEMITKELQSTIYEVSGTAGAEEDKDVEVIENDDEHHAEEGSGVGSGHHDLPVISEDEVLHGSTSPSAATDTAIAVDNKSNDGDDNSNNSHNNQPFSIPQQGAFDLHQHQQATSNLQLQTSPTLLLSAADLIRKIMKQKLLPFSKQVVINTSLLYLTAVCFIHLILPFLSRFLL